MSTPACPDAALAAPIGRARPRRVRAIGLGIALLGGLVAGGCQSSTSDRDVALVGLEAARGLTGRVEGRLGGIRVGAWVDPRRESDWLTERIPGSIHAPIGSLRSRSDELAGYDVLVVYGDRYKDAIAVAAAKVLAEMGIAEVRLLEGGLQSYADSGLPTASGEPAPDELPPAIVAEG